MSVDIHNDVANHYYSGQGVVLIGQRDAFGNPVALLPLGNCKDLKIDIASSIIDHKGSQDGQRAIDKRLVTETKGTATLTLENWLSRNLATALRGTNVPVAAGAVTSQPLNAYVGAVTPLRNIGGVQSVVQVSALVLTQAQAGWPTGTLTEYVNDSTAWDYKWNADAGSFQINNGTQLSAPVKAAIPLTGTPTGTITSNSLAISGLTTWQTGMNPMISVGDTVSLWGVTGAGAATVNGIAGTVTAVSATTLTVTIPGSSGVVTLATTTIVVPITQASTGLPWPFAVTAAFNYGAQFTVEALNVAPQELYLRFEGLNTNDTINGAFSPVVVEIFRFGVDPLKELALISDTFGEFVIEGAVLSDPTKTTGSKFFHVSKLN